jgi:hypothetical protein
MKSLRSFVLGLFAVTIVAVGLAWAANVKWSNSASFPLLGTPDGSENLVGFKTGANFKTPLSGVIAIQSLAVPVSSAQILSSHSVPVEIIPAPGAGKFIALISTAWQYKGDTAKYGSVLAESSGLYFSNNLTYEIDDCSPTSLLTGITDGIKQGASAAGSATPGINAAVVFYTQGGNPDGGSIMTTSKSAGGSGYASGDTGYIAAGDNGAHFIVDTVDGGGAVLTYHLSSVGGAYVVSSNVATASSILGPILTTSLGAGGSGYAIGDTGSIAFGAAIYVVDTVDGGGAVLTYHLTNPGTNYQVESGASTSVLTGAGDGNFTINILSVRVGDGNFTVDILSVEAGNGTLIAFVDYTIKTAQ